MIDFTIDILKCSMGVLIAALLINGVESLTDYIRNRR